MKERIELKTYIKLHLVLIVYSLATVFSKAASMYPFLSKDFFLFYSFTLICMCGYALAWQQILKRIPLTTAYANKAVTVLWGIVWGILFFNETLTVFNILGTAIIIFGIYLVVKSDV